MEFLSRFTLYDVFLVAIGLVLASTIRIFNNLCKEQKRLEEFDLPAREQYKLMYTYMDSRK